MRRALALRLKLIVLVVAICSLALPAYAQVVRFALVAGNNRGHDRQSSLRYAENDARRFASLLTDLGDFSAENVELITAGRADEFTQALDRINQRIKQQVPSRYQRALLVVFFSGHADGINLEFGSDHLAYARLRELVEESAAQIKVVFVDSCQSGGLTAVKGGRPGPSFDLVLTDNIEASGTVIVTSSSAGENSQESSELQGSFYTHYLLSGLRGAADHNHDHKVTLAEVYQYAYSKTVVETARTLSGTQHPTYDYQIAGRGQVVLTDLARGQAVLDFGPQTRGKFLVVKKDTDEVVAEVTKPFGSRQQLALPAGSYLVAQQRDGRLYASQVTLTIKDRFSIDPQKMREHGSLVASVKSGGTSRSGIGMFLHYGLMSGALRNLAVVHQAVIGARIDLGPLTLFPAFGYGEANIEQERLSYHMNMYTLQNYLTWRLEYSVLDLFVGLNLGVSYGTQHLPNEKNFSGTMFAYGLVAGMDLPLYKGLTLQLFWEVGSNVFKLDREFSQYVTLKGLIGVGYQF